MHIAPKDSADFNVESRKKWMFQSRQEVFLQNVSNFFVRQVIDNSVHAGSAYVIRLAVCNKLCWQWCWTVPSWIWRSSQFSLFFTTFLLLRLVSEIFKLGCILSAGSAPLLSTMSTSLVVRCLSALRRVGSSTYWRPLECASYSTTPLSHELITPSFETPMTHYMMHLHRCGPQRKIRQKKTATEGRPFIKGVVLKTLIKKPKKPNSANRKCVRVRLTTGREAVAYVPGIGHNLQEHHIVLVRGGRVQDLPGVKLKCVRGKYDLAHVKKTT